MKLKLLASLAAMMMVPGTAYAMDCCKDGKCSCCAPKDETATPAPQGGHQH